MRMTITPGEQFEHAYDQDTDVIVVAGTVELVMDGQRVSLDPDARRRVGANVSHTLTNPGEAPAVVDCVAAREHS